MKEFSRSELLIGESSLQKLKNSSVAVFGLGGVGGFCVEALCRSGIGSLALFDGDIIEESNINRQIIATLDCVGKDKVSVFKSRLLSINKDVKIESKKTFYLPENADEIDLKKYDYIVDAIDTVTAKIELIVRAKTLNIPIISCLGTGGKTEIEKLKVADIYSTSTCPLAKVLRKELRARNVESLKVVYSEEVAIKEKDGVIPSMIFVPATAGLLLAREVVKDLTEKDL